MIACPVPDIGRGGKACSLACLVEGGSEARGGWGSTGIVSEGPVLLKTSLAAFSVLSIVPIKAVSFV